ncbi:MAG: putative baseplate assembly protein [Polyangiales bacterium]
MSTDLRCRSSHRRARVRDQGALTGVDDVAYVVAPATGAPPVESLQLVVYLLREAPEALRQPAVWRVEGGRRVRDLRVVAVARRRDPEGFPSLLLTLDRAGDASPYTLRLVRDRDRDLRPPPGVDPRYDRATFTFKPDCPAQLDCAEPAAPCERAEAPAPALDYLARDYTSFRQLLLDRLSLALPAWRERHAPDVGVTLVELMAYVGDHLAYRQDVVATEAYLDTARLRTSVRRHARLVDYAMHDGVNARAWVAVCVDTDVTWRLDAMTFYTRVPAWPDLVDAAALPQTDAPYEVFRPVERGPVTLRAALGRIPFYTWDGDECCLPKGATRATLDLGLAPREEGDPQRDPRQRLLLHPGDVLVFEEVVGPSTGRAEHADPAHRHAVRLTRVEPVVDPLRALDLKTREPQWMHEVEWMPEDALPFPLCLSSLDPANGCAPIPNVSVARGNVILVDHGRPVDQPDLGHTEGVPPTPRCDAPNRPAFQEQRARPFRPRLSQRPLTFRAPIPAWEMVDARGMVAVVPPPASVMLGQDPRAALPDVTLASDEWRQQGAVRVCPRCGARDEAPREGASAPPPPPVASVCEACGATIEPLTWAPRRDLLDSSGDDAHFVVEVDDDGAASLRFGDDVHGRSPEPWAAFRASYRVGNGPAGNVPAESIAHLAVRGERGGAVRVRNPMPAAGGVGPEPVDDVRLLAPESLRARRERAVVAEDYAELALRDRPALQRAAATLQWTGSWYEARVGLDPRGSEDATPALVAAVARDLERYRRIGHDLRVEGARYVPVYLDLKVCARPEHLREHVRRAVLDALVGPAGFFRPDNLTFGRPLVLSALVAAVQAAPGVLDVTVRRMERLHEGAAGEREAGELAVGPMEIVELANDPLAPERGRIELEIGGGR